MQWMVFGCNVELQLLFAAAERACDYFLELSRWVTRAVVYPAPQSLSYDIGPSCSSKQFEVPQTGFSLFN